MTFIKSIALCSSFGSSEHFLQGKSECFEQAWREGACFNHPHYYYEQCCLADIPSPTWLYSVSVFHEKVEFFIFYYLFNQV